MPGFTTHYILGMKAYNDLPNNQLKFIIAKYRWLYQLGLQGPDIFFYNIPVLRHRDYRNVGSYMHEHHVNDFFAACLKHLAAIPSRQQREPGIAYVAGFFCHYIGDYICHPFVYGRIHHDPTNPSMKTHGLHALLENDLDALLLSKYKKKKPSQFNQAATICLNGLETQFISRFLADCINEAYYPLTYKNNYQVTAAMVHRSILAIRFGCRTLADPNGKKKDKIAFVENIFLRKPVASQKLVTDEVEDPRRSLNSDHQVWTNPWDASHASTASFPQLFRRCLGKCSTVYYYLNSAITKDGLLEGLFPVLLDELGNYSYHSGLPVDDEQ
ncbi:MAG: zinc dependent phospholipase C family protein [Lachnospiraceae bacterium]|nr:zinc dependent phospholipase C family protein [Lachnospiraceae bacterium]